MAIEYKLTPEGLKTFGVYRLQDEDLISVFVRLRSQAGYSYNLEHTRHTPPNKDYVLVTQHVDVLNDEFEDPSDQVSVERIIRNIVKGTTVINNI